jgi:hypothetical protein
MKVIGAGFGRTGTTSLKVALADLGLGPCYHMKELIANPQHAHFWTAALDGAQVDWKAFFADYQSTVDWPGCHFYRQLMAEYPDAKVLLSVRDPEAWYESCRNTIFKITQVFPVALARKLMPWLPFAAPGRIASRMIWQQTFDNRFADKAYALEVFHRHIEEVKQYVKPERLLVFDVKEGWEPLCRFLEVPVPKDKPFPRLNDTQEFQQNIKRVQIMSSAALGLGAVGTVALLRWLGRR